MQLLRVKEYYKSNKNRTGLITKCWGQISAALHLPLKPIQPTSNSFSSYSWQFSLFLLPRYSAFLALSAFTRDRLWLLSDKDTAPLLVSFPQVITEDGVNTIFCLLTVLVWVFIAVKRYHGNYNSFNWGGLLTFLEVQSIVIMTGNMVVCRCAASSCRQQEVD